MRQRAVLDDEDGLRSIDRAGMVDLIGTLPEDMARLVGRGMTLEPDPEGLKGVVFSGMGGSAMGGEIIRTWLGPRLTVPVHICRGYEAPPFAGPGTLFMSVSFSGNTEETLSAFQDAMDKGCQVLALSSGGALEEKARSSGVPHHRIEAPKGMVPRAALGHMLVPLAMTLKAAGLVEVGEDLAEVVEVLASLREQVIHTVPWEHNESKRIASQLHDKVPVVHGHGILEVAAQRWKTQLNENSKVMAWADFIPEMDHNSIVGWDGDRAAQEHASVILRDRISEEDVRVRDRIEATKEVAWSKAGSVLEVWSEGKGTLARIMSSIYKGDFASVYLAILRKVDPTPVQVIEDLKARLKGRK